MNSGKMDYPIVLACDEAYAMPLATTLRSIVEANPGNCPLDFHVFSDGISEYTRKKVLDSLPKGSASIRWVEVDLKPFKEFSTIAHISKITYARFLIPTIFPDTVSKILYLDADILVLDDLASLWETDLDGAVVGAVIDFLDLHIKQNEPAFAHVPRVRDYFNAGVLLINLDRWRKEQISEKAMAYLALHPESPYSDQDALNVVCDGRWKKLDSRWNFHSHVGKNFLEMDPNQWPGIVHFVTKVKPWDARVPNANACFYDSFRRRTHFARTPVDKLHDKLWGGWHYLKRFLRRYPFLRTLWIRTISSVRTPL